MDIKEIALDNKHGSETLSMNLIKVCLENYLSGIDFKKDLQYLIKEKREMVQLVNISKKLMLFNDESEFRNLIDELNESKKMAIKNSYPIFKKSNIVTISWSSLVEEAILYNRDKIEVIKILESRPKNEGLAFAKYLKEKGFNVILFTDASIYHALDEDSIVLVGMDALLSRLELVNKVGTYLFTIHLKR